MKYLLCILIVAIACCGPAKIKTLKNYDHTKDSLFAQKLNTVLLREFGGEFHSMEFSDKSESWVSKIDPISWPCDTLVMENFKYEISLLTNHVKDSVTPASSYLAIGCYISEGDAESAFKRYQ